MTLQRKINKVTEELSTLKKGGFNSNEDCEIVEENSQKGENSAKGLGCDMDEEFIKMLIRNEFQDNE